MIRSTSVLYGVRSWKRRRWRVTPAETEESSPWDQQHDVGNIEELSQRQVPQTPSILGPGSKGSQIEGVRLLNECGSTRGPCFGQSYLASLLRFDPLHLHDRANLARLRAYPQGDHQHTHTPWTRGGGYARGRIYDHYDCDAGGKTARRSIQRR